MNKRTPFTIFFSFFITFSFFTNTHAQIKPMGNFRESISKDFYVIGIATRTTNQNGQSSKDIEALWLKFWNGSVRERIVSKVSDDIYAVYFDYETDYTGHYTTLVGLPVSSLENIPEGFTGITIKASKYRKFISRGKMPGAVFSTWMEIWNNKELNSNRAYQSDFTIHGKKYYDGDNAEVETYISLK
jgi:predicted transcriptional regulator YdeE